MFDVMEKLYARIPLLFTPTLKFIPASATPVRICIMSKEECKNASGVDCVDRPMQIGPPAARTLGLWTIAQVQAWTSAAAAGTNYPADALQFRDFLQAGMSTLVKGMLIVVAS